MSKRIPQSFLTDLLARVDIVEIIGNRIQLKKAGANYQALCPFHNEKTASFSVSQSKQFYYCFGCGAHGNAIGFLMNYDRMEFLDAVETLAHNVGIEIPYEANDENRGQLQELYQLLQQANKLYQQQLRQSDIAINYLKQRGLSGEICQKYNIGFSVDDWDKILTSFPKQQNTLIANGLLITTNGAKKYDRFRNRIMFPIRDVRGRVIGFGGRALGDDAPKYLNSPETPVFHKGHELYGLYEARQSNSNLPYVIIVEGYLDVIALAQFGINNVVATLGTATTSKHVQKLFRYASKLIFCFDGDQAGLKAAWRALENTLPLMRDGVQAQFLFLPKGEDPDSQIRTEGKDAFCRAIDDAIPLSEFLFDHLSKQINTSTMDGRAQMAHQASALLKTMPNGVFKQLMYEKLAKLVHMEAVTLQNLDNSSRHLDNARYSALDAESIVRVNNVEQLQQPSLVRSAIKLMLHNPKLADHVADLQQIADIDLPNISVLTQLLKLAKQQQNLTTGLLLECWRDQKEAQTLAKLTAQELLIPAENLQQEFIGIIERLYEHGREKTIETLMQQTSRGEISNKDKIKLQKLISDAKLKII